MQKNANFQIIKSALRQQKLDETADRNRKKILIYSRQSFTVSATSNVRLIPRFKSPLTHLPKTPRFPSQSHITTDPTIYPQPHLGPFRGHAVKSCTQSTSLRCSFVQNLYNLMQNTGWKFDTRTIKCKYEKGMGKDD